MTGWAILAGCAAGLVVLALCWLIPDRFIPKEQRAPIKRSDRKLPPPMNLAIQVPERKLDPDWLRVVWADGDTESIAVYTYVSVTARPPFELIIAAYREPYDYPGGSGWYSTGERRINLDHVREWSLDRAEPRMMDDEGEPLDDQSNPGVG